MPCVRVKDGVKFDVISPAGFHILAAIECAAGVIAHDLTITSGTDGEHSGPEDPHHKGEAYDMRIHDLPDPHLALQAIQNFLGTDRFFAWIEDEASENRHIHVQLKHGMLYPPPSLTTHDEVEGAAEGEA